ncbi:MAG: DNA topoisomerase, partial [Deltaproteobacteria bacterium]|nr:DNA topoisomerase [Deltaproteobacteria bacterium]
SNYDGTLSEPGVLPARIPNLLINGASGIAVGMATNIPPHNLTEVCQALIHLIDNDEADTAEIMSHIKGPDFPTGGQIILAADELVEIYRRGKGGIKVRGQFEVETLKRGRKQLIITSIPYSVNKAKLVEKIAALIASRRLPMVVDVKDESTENVRIVLELKNGRADPAKVMAYLFKHTEMEINYPLNFTCLTPGAVPERLSIKEILNHYLDFRKEVVVRKLRFEQANLEKRIHILHGFSRIFVDLDAAIAIIRVARDRAEAHENLKARFDLDDEQAKAILELRLHSLVRLEISKIEEELRQREKRLRQIKAILGSGVKIWQAVRREITAIKKIYGDARRTAVIASAAEYTYDKEDFVVHEDVFVVVTRNGWLKRVKTFDVRTQLLKEGDEILAVIGTNTSNTVAFFSNFGQVYVSRVYDLHVSGKGYGDPIQTVFTFQDQERLVAALPGEVNGPAAAATALQEKRPVTADQYGQLTFLADNLENKAAAREQSAHQCLVVTRQGRGFRFDRSSLKETTTRKGRSYARLAPGDEVLGVCPLNGSLLALATSRRLLIIRMAEVKALAGVGRGVRLMQPEPPGILFFCPMNADDVLLVENSKGTVRELQAAQLPIHKRGAKGKLVRGGIVRISLKSEEATGNH